MTKKRPRRPSRKNSDEPRMSSAERFQLEYAYVIKDLRYILLLAIAMFALLILLNIFLR